MLSWLKGPRPDITPAQIIAGIPLIGNVLAAYGIFTPTQAQTDTLQQALFWGIGLFVADAAVRGFRNISDGMKAKKVP